MPLLLLLLRLLIASGDAPGYRIAHSRDGSWQADEHSLSNDDMADVQLADFREGGKVCCRVEVEAMARVNLKTRLRRKLRRSRQPL